jgi:hypothetical protein
MDPWRRQTRLYFRKIMNAIEGLALNRKDGKLQHLQRINPDEGKFKDNLHWVDVKEDEILDLEMFHKNKTTITGPVMLYPYRGWRVQNGFTLKEKYHYGAGRLYLHELCILLVSFLIRLKFDIMQ